MTLIGFFSVLQKWGLLLMMASLLIYLFRKKKSDGWVTTLSGLLVLTSAHYLLEGIMLSMAESDKWRPYVAEVWYPAYAITDLLYVFVVVKICNHMRWRLTIFSQTLLMGYFLLAFIQVVRYFDRLLIGTNLLGEFYRSSIPAINSGVVMLVVIATFMETVKRKEANNV